MLLNNKEECWGFIKKTLQYDIFWVLLMRRYYFFVKYINCSLINNLKVLLKYEYVYLSVTMTFYRVLVNKPFVVIFSQYNSTAFLSLIQKSFAPCSRKRKGYKIDH